MPRSMMLLSLLQLLGYWVMGLVWRSKPIKEVKNKRNPSSFKERAHTYMDPLWVGRGLVKNQRINFDP
jgi:hypothetical protein